MQKIVLVVLALVAVVAASKMAIEDGPQEKLFFNFPFIPLPSLPINKPVVTGPAVCPATPATAVCGCGPKSCQIGETCTATCTPPAGASPPKCPATGTKATAPCTCGTLGAGTAATQCTAGQDCDDSIATAPKCT